MAQILLAGEQVTSTAIEVKGADCFTVHQHKEDGEALVAAISGDGKHEVTWMRTCHVPVQFPERLADLERFDVVILSDVGSNSLLFHPEVFAKSIRHPNRLTMLRDYVDNGGGLIMVGGWMSFAGVDGRARYHGTAVEQALPVTCLPYDDRQEIPEGIVPTVASAGHPVLQGITGPWPFFLGYNRVTPKPQAEVILKIGNDPLLALHEFGQGRSAAFTSDCAPHWGPPEFLEWPHYARFWRNLVQWVKP